MIQLQDTTIFRNTLLSIGLLLATSLSSLSHAQCNAVPGEISGTVFLDGNNNGANDDGGVNSDINDLANIASILVNAYDANGVLVDHALTNLVGNYTLENLDPSKTYRLEFRHADDLYPSRLGADQKSNIQFIQGNACNVNYGIVTKGVIYQYNPNIMITCFATENVDLNGNVISAGTIETIVGLEHEFSPSSAPYKIASKAETGSIWGLAYQKSKRQLFSSAFIKQNSTLLEDGLGNGMHDAIYKTDMSDDNAFTTSLFTRLSDLGIAVSPMTEQNPRNCNYGDQVGRLGLGAIALSPDDKTLYAVNIGSKSIVAINASNPNASTTKEINIVSDVNLNGKIFYPFALKFYKDKLYVGITITGQETQNASDSKVNVLEYDFDTKLFKTIFSTSYNKGYWTDNKNASGEFVNQLNQHWLTDIDFVSDDYMVIGLSDRKGHRYCKGINSRLDDQKADILMVYKDENGIWNLENGGKVGSLGYKGVKTGQETSNGEGPGGGEFFGDDFFTEDPSYHNETSLGSFMIIPGKKEIVSAVFDPYVNTYSGGVHRYSTENGGLVGTKELYRNNNISLFGKATGFGDITAATPKTLIEIGNVVWIDENKDGVQDPLEPVLANINLELYDDNCTKIGETITDNNGLYVFNHLNVDIDNDGNMDGPQPHETYYIVVANSSFNKSNGALTVNGANYVVTNANSGSTSFPDGNDNDAVIADNICSSINGLPVIEVNTADEGINNHNYDFGFTNPGKFDLALKKEVVGDNYVRVGDIVEFKITVYNQGELGAKDIIITDYIPEGLGFNAPLNFGWTPVGNNVEFTIKNLAAGTETELFIQLYIKPGFSHEDFINYAEISAANDQFGGAGDDVDSTPDSDFTNDVGGVPFQTTDNQLDDNGNLDEDDHDPATVKVFDLALIKKLVNVQSSYLPGDQVDFEITVYNQGNVDAKNITITDYLPLGTSTLSANGWSIAGDNYERTISELKAGEQTIIPIQLTISNNEEIEFVNYAEISSAYTPENTLAVDLDSYANNNKSDDKGGEVNGSSDNLTQDPTGNDEDDHDPASFVLSRFDLALMKEPVTKSAKPGEIVEFEITIYNQGTITVSEVSIIDYMPEALEYVETNGWTKSADRITATLSSSNGLLPNYGLIAGESVSIVIKAKISESAKAGQITNYSEIISAKDFNGVDRTNEDQDSHPDDNNTNDTGGIVNSSTDNMISNKGEIDEDDHDPAAITVLFADFLVRASCLNNAELNAPGQEYNIISIFTDVENEDWKIISTSNLFQGLASQDQVPNIGAYTQGTQVTTTDFEIGVASPSLSGVSGFGQGLYSFEGISLSDQAVSVTLSNGTETLVLTSPASNVYIDQIVTGQSAVCASNTTTYCVENADPGAEYEWSLSSGGVISGPNNGSCVDITWDAGASGPNTVYVTRETGCYNVGELDVQVGIPGGFMACIGAANISLDGNCQLEVTADLVLQNAITVENVYDVIVMDAQGNMLPEPIITGEYIGVPMTIKVVDVCSGNSCWTSITVNDKMKPTVLVSDLTVSCTEMESLPFPLATDNCDPSPVVSLVSQTSNNLMCNDLYTTEITRVFKATDNRNNVSNNFTQKIFLERLDVNDIIFPEARTVANGNPVFCQQYDLDANGNPAPSTTGFPTYQGVNIFPYQDVYCSFAIDYKDQIIAPNGCVTKVMRTWTAFEWWCGQALVNSFVQEINIADQLPPQFVVPSNLTVTTNTGQCFATVNLPAVSPIDDCSTTFDVDIQYPNGFLNNSNGGNVNLELGENVITYTVYDGCLNSSSQVFVVDVIDNTAPVMVCDQNTVVSLKADGTAYAYASSFDDGSVEDCSALTFEVRRMDNGSACGISNFTFGPIVQFCCADVGVPVQVILRAIDAEGNSNSCMVNVIIQDKNPPLITVPADLTIQCTDTYDINDLAATFGSASATDNCLNTTITEIPSIDINSCNTGTIVRTFIASDGNGQAVGTQFITVENNSVFSENDIVWPQDFTTTVCNPGDLQPEDLDAPFDVPVLFPDACDQIDLGYVDQQFTTTDGACFKIIRRWMVMDMCNLTMTGQPTMFIHEQTIVVSNNVKPMITSDCGPVSSSLNSDCFEGDITLGASATDDCTPTASLANSYFIDLDNDGSFDFSSTGFGGTISVTGTYPLGNHRIVYQFGDRCGNTETCTQFFTIFNDTPPLAYCQNLSVELTPMDTDGDNILDAEMAFLDVELIGGNSESFCGGPVTISYDVAGDSTIATFDCFDLGVNIVTIYVTDEFGLQSSCNATIIIQDNNNVDICPTPLDCIVWPDTMFTVSTCVANLDPSTILSETVVTEPCVCGNFVIDYIDTDISNPATSCATILRTWSVTFNCFSSPLIYTFDQTITQLNAFAPVITSCPGNVSGMSTNATCTAFVNIGLPTFDQSCTFGGIITNNSSFANSQTGDASGDYPVGITTVIYTVTDACGNASTCSLDVEVNDLGAPICTTQDITVTIPSTGGIITIADDAVDNGSVDDCGTIVSYSTTPNMFSCDNLGDNSVVMTVTDNSGNTSTCIAIVTVEDDVAPICSAGSLTLTLFSNSTVTITGEMLDNGSVDTCGTIVSYEATPNTFSCADAGINDVILTVTDNNGNTSTCIGTVTIIDGVAPICVPMNASIILDGNGNYTLDPSEVDGGSSDVCGTTINLSVSPNQFDCDDLGANDVILTVTDGNGNSSTCNAVVTVTDTIAPICNAGTANITLFNANVQVTVPASFVDAGSIDPCGTIVSRTITPNMFGCANLGLNSVILTVTDDSGNSSTCEGFVNVMDMIPPVAVAQDITVTIGVDGLAVITGLDIDNGSFDNCGTIVSYMATPDTFDCTNLGDNTVILKVTDNGGKMSTDIAIVTVVSMDTLLCVAQDVTLFLDNNGDALLTPQQVDNGSMAPCGSTISLSLSRENFFCNDAQLNPTSVLLTVTDDISGETDTCSANITVLDTFAPTIICPLDLTFDCTQDLSDESIFGAIEFDDNCAGSLMLDTITVENLNICGVGTITKTYVVMDQSGNTTSCIQNITIEVASGALFSEANITWPVTPITITDCSMTSPEAIGSFPEIDSAGLSCFVLSIDYVDMSIGMSGTCLDTIERTWTVIDSCQLSTGGGIFNFVQTLFLDDSDVPIIIGLPTDTLVFSSDTTCNVFVDLSAATVLDCSMSLTVTNDSPFSNNANSLDASGIYPTGVTEVTLTATDACGNTGTFTINVNVQDTVPPAAICEKVFVEITDDGTVTVESLMNVASLSDNCTDSSNITVLFILDFDETDTNLLDNILVPSITFTCDDIGVQSVFLIFIDEFGNYTFCNSGVGVSDPNGFCGTTPSGNLVYGGINTQNGIPVSNVEVNLLGSSNKLDISDQSGSYGFSNLSDNASFEITPSLNTNHAEGVTTLDVLVIQKHIMNTDELDNPYDYIAADVDGSTTITGSDLVILQKLILGTIKEFPSMPSFRFVNANYNFIMPDNPLVEEFPETAAYSDVFENVIQDFVAVKLGDVNGSFSGLVSNEDKNPIYIHGRSVHTLSVGEVAKNPSNGIVEVPVYSEYFNQLQALEMNLAISDGTIVGLKAGKSDITDTDYVIENLGKTARISWVNTFPLDVKEGDIMFTLLVRTDKSLIPSDIVSLVKSRNEFYDTNYGIAELRFARDKKEINQNSAVLYQNSPNPWTSETMISFDMVNDADYTLNFFNIDGKLVHTINGFGTKGYNSINVTKRDMQTNSGVIVCEFTSGSRRLTNRMILIE